MVITNEALGQLILSNILNEYYRQQVEQKKC